VPATGNQPAIIHRFFPVIANKGNDCFLNSSFQLLLPAFDSIEARRILGTAHKGMDPLQCLLADCFLALGKQSMAHSTLLWSQVADQMERLKVMLGGLILKHKIGQQNDPADVIRIILEKMPWFGSMFKFSMITNSQCTGACQEVYLQPAVVDTGLNITVEFQQEVGAAVDHMFTATRNDGVDCEKCKSKTSKIQKTVLNSLPAFLLVTIKVQGIVAGRVEQQDLQGYRSLDLASVLNPEWQGVNATYSLISAVMHVGGSTAQGHYLAQHCYRDPRMDVVISDARSWPSRGQAESPHLQLQHSARILLYKRNANAQSPASVAAGSESVYDVPALPAEMASGAASALSSAAASQAATQNGRGPLGEPAASAAGSKCVASDQEPFFTSVQQMVQHAKGLGCTCKSPASMLSCSDVDASSTPMARFTTPVIAYACMVGDEFFMPLATESEVAAAGLTCSPAFLVRIVQSCIGDGTLRVYLKDFVAQQHGTNRTLSFSRELISRTLCFINAHKECKGVLQMISVQVHSHFSSLKLKLERAADLALLVQR